jgi:hypothetical protein
LRRKSITLRSWPIVAVNFSANRGLSLAAQLIFDRPDCGLRSIRDIQFAQDVLNMLFGRLNANPKGPSNFAVTQPNRDVL